MASILGRLLQSLFVTDKGQEGRLQIYVDDPLLAVKGTKSRRRLLAARFIALAIVLRVRLAFPKAQLSNSVVQIGVQLTVTSLKVRAAIPSEKLAALRKMIETMLHINVVLSRTHVHSQARLPTLPH